MFWLWSHLNIPYCYDIIISSLMILASLKLRLEQFPFHKDAFVFSPAILLDISDDFTFHSRSFLPESPPEYIVIGHSVLYRIYLYSYRSYFLPLFRPMLTTTAIITTRLKMTFSFSCTYHRLYLTGGWKDGGGVRRRTRWKEDAQSHITSSSRM